MEAEALQEAVGNAVLLFKSLRAERDFLVVSLGEALSARRENQNSESPEILSLRANLRKIEATLEVLEPYRTGQKPPVSVRFIATI